MSRGAVSTEGTCSAVQTVGKTLASVVEPEIEINIFEETTADLDTFVERRVHSTWSPTAWDFPECETFC